MESVKEYISTKESDFVVSFLQSQLVGLQNLVSSVEDSQKVERAYVSETLRRIEREVVRFRKLLA